METFEVTEIEVVPGQAEILELCSTCRCKPRAPKPKGGYYCMCSKCRKSHAKWRSNNRQYQREYNKKWRQANPDYQNQWLSRNPDYHRNYYNRKKEQLIGSQTS